MAANWDAMANERIVVTALHFRATDRAATLNSLTFGALTPTSGAVHQIISGLAPFLAGKSTIGLEVRSSSVRAPDVSSAVFANRVRV